VKKKGRKGKKKRQGTGTSGKQTQLRKTPRRWLKGHSMKELPFAATGAPQGEPAAQEKKERQINVLKNANPGSKKKKTATSEKTGKKKRRKRQQETINMKSSSRHRFLGGGGGKTLEILKRGPKQKKVPTISPKKGKNSESVKAVSLDGNSQLNRRKNAKKDLNTHPLSETLTIEVAKKPGGRKNIKKKLPGRIMKKKNTTYACERSPQTKSVLRVRVRKNPKRGGNRSKIESLSEIEKIFPKKIRRSQKKNTTNDFTPNSEDLGPFRRLREEREKKSKQDSPKPGGKKSILPSTSQKGPLHPDQAVSNMQGPFKAGRGWQSCHRVKFRG